MSKPSLPALPAETYHRTIFLGDSITDGNSYPLLVQDAFQRAGLPPMLGINAGIGGNTAAEMFARLDRDVLPYNPTLVTLYSGGNDAARGVTVQQFKDDMRATIMRITAKQIELILFSTLSRKAGKQIYSLYNTVLTELANEFNLRFARVDKCIEQASKEGIVLFAPDGHPGYQGQRMIARALLDAMGYAEIPVPERPSCSLRPGVIKNWLLYPTEKAELSFDEISALLPADDRWTKVILPLAEALTNDEDLWLDDYRQQGMATNIAHLVRENCDHFLGCAIINSPVNRTMYLHTGAQLQTVWLNGKKVYKNNWQHGWHAGRESVLVDLLQGDNTFIIETGTHFFLSLTENIFWQ